MKLDQTLIRQRIEELENIIFDYSPVEREDDGTEVRISVIKGIPRFYLRKNSKDRLGTYVRAKENPQAFKVIQRGYDLDVLKRAKEELNYLRRFLIQYPQKVYEDIYPDLHPERQKIVIPAELPTDEFVREWEGVTWEPKGFRADDESEYYNKKGVRMKSKEETILSNYFIDREIPQRYEYPIYLKGMGKVYPDFMLLNKRTRKEYYWEHLGLMDERWYSQKAIRKLIAYQRSGIYIGEQLLLTFETSTYRPGLYDINQLIDHYLI